MPLSPYLCDGNKGEMPDLMTLFPPPAAILSDASLFLDLDGTILELADTPSSVDAGAHVQDLLELATRKLKGRVAIISGRSAANVRELLPGIGVSIGGSHGHELHWADGRNNAPARAPGLDTAITEMRDLQASTAGVLVEEKPFGVALHYRLAPHAEEACTMLARRLAEETGLPLQPGKMVQELKSSTANKGDAVAAFMAEPPMDAGKPIFIGDDLNDEPGFAAARRLGGTAILVGPERATAAEWRLPDVASLRSWLRASLEALA